jgi:formate dehydrogenase major subunit
MECVVVQDIFLNETAKFAHVFLPGSSFLEKDGTFTNAERRISVRKVMEPLGGKADWEGTVALANALGYPMDYRHPSEIMDEIARLTPTFTGVSYAELDRHGSLQWPCNAAAPDGTPTMHIEEFVRGKGASCSPVRAHRREGQQPLSAAADHRAHPQPVQRRRADPAHRQRCLARGGPPGNPPDRRREPRHQRRRLGRHRQPCRADRAARAVTERVAPGVVYTTFHFPESGPT